MTTDRVVVYGDFNCPWSYLAARRVAVLAADGVEVDWRAVQHERPNRFTDHPVRFDCLREEMDRVVAELLPEEELPYSLAGFVPYTKAALSGYAEAYAVGVAADARDLLFEAFWMHSLDLSDALVVRTLLIDAVRSGSSSSDLLREWGYAVAVSGGPVSTTAWRLIADWAERWKDAGKETVPVVIVGEAAPLFGIDAVEWLGAELVRRGLDPGPVPEPRPPGRRSRVGRDLPSLSWVSMTGNPWLHEYRAAHRRLQFPTAG